MKRLVLSLACAAALALGLVLGVSQATASNPKYLVTLSCANGTGATDYQILLNGWSELIVGSSPRMNYVIVSQTDATGTEVLHNSSADPGGRPLVTCTYIGPVTGRLWINTGFFTPAGQ